MFCTENDRNVFTLRCRLLIWGLNAAWSLSGERFPRFAISWAWTIPQGIIGLGQTSPPHTLSLWTTYHSIVSHDTLGSRCGLSYILFVVTIPRVITWGTIYSFPYIGSRIEPLQSRSRNWCVSPYIYDLPMVLIDKHPKSWCYNLIKFYRLLIVYRRI